MSDLVGKTIGKFEITADLGGGGMAEVFKAYQPSLNRHVAIKVIHRFLATNEEFLGRFQREAQNVAALRHPNIVQVHDFDIDNGRPYMVMEFIDGPTLDKRTAERQKEGNPWSLAEVIQIISDIGTALAYAHEQEMIHRDIKPGNVMCHPNGRFILTDFGLAKLLTGANVTATGTIMGTPAYMSPEQCQGVAGDHRSDIYSLGILLYELATGKLPFEADTQVGYIMKHVSEQPPLPDTINPQLPTWLTAVILRALAKEPNGRYSTMHALLADLQQQTQPTVPAIPTSQPTSTSPTPAIREKAESVGKFFAARLKKEPKETIEKDTPTPSPALEAAKTKAESLTRFFTTKPSKADEPDETANQTLAEPQSPQHDSKTSIFNVLTNKEERATLQDEIKSGLEEARASLGAKQDELTSRGLETADRLRGKLQSTLETAVEKTAAAQRKRYTILITSTVVSDINQQPDPPLLQQANHDLHSIIASHNGELVQLTDYGFIALFETPSGDKEAPLQAIAAGQELLETATVIQTALPPFKLRVGIHTGVLAPHELDGDSIAITRAVTDATPFGQLYLSHATYRLILWQIQTEKREVINTTADKTLQLHSVIP